MRTLKRTRSRKPSKKQLTQQREEQEKLDAQVRAKAIRDRAVNGTVTARLGIIAYELDLLIAACSDDLDGQSLAWLKTQAMLFHNSARVWRLRGESMQLFALAK